MLGKLKEPAATRKLLFRNCRYSPPILSEWRPHWQLTVSPAIKLVSPRPDGKFDGPPKLSAPPAMLICGNPIGCEIPFRMPKSAGLSCALGVFDPNCRLNPKRA